jgi:hypothetical protein
VATGTLLSLRVVTFAGLAAVAAAAFGGLSYDQCTAFGKAPAFLFALEQALASFILAVRTSAIVDARRQPWKFYVIGSAWVALVACMIVLAAFTTATHIPGGGCVSGTTTNAFVLTYYAIVAFDLLNIIWSSITLYPVSTRQKEGVARRLLRNGIQYYAITLIVNLLNAIFFSLSDTALKSLFAALASSLTAVFAGRLILSHVQIGDKGGISTFHGSSADNGITSGRFGPVPPSYNNSPIISKGSPNMSVLPVAMHSMPMRHNTRGSDGPYFTHAGGHMPSSHGDMLPSKADHPYSSRDDAPFVRIDSYTVQHKSPSSDL